MVRRYLSESVAVSSMISLSKTIRSDAQIGKFHCQVWAWASRSTIPFDICTFCFWTVPAAVWVFLFYFIVVAGTSQLDGIVAKTRFILSVFIFASSVLDIVLKLACSYF